MAEMAMRTAINSALVQEMERDERVIMIGTDIDEGLRRHCLLEEMVQMMGLPNDACFYRPSLFCEDDYVSGMTQADIMLFKTLYDPRLQPGMAREDALPIARQILAELSGETDQDSQP